MDPLVGDYLKHQEVREVMKTLRERMTERCTSQYCCPHMTTLIVDESIELFFELKRNAKMCHSVATEDTLERLALKRTAAKHGAVERFTPQ